MITTSVLLILFGAVVHNTDGIMLGNAVCACNIHQACPPQAMCPPPPPPEPCLCGRKLTRGRKTVEGTKFIDPIELDRKNDRQALFSLSSKNTRHSPKKKADLQNSTLTEEHNPKEQKLGVDKKNLNTEMQNDISVEHMEKTQKRNESIIEKLIDNVNQPKVNVNEKIVEFIEEKSKTQGNDEVMEAKEQSINIQEQNAIANEQKDKTEEVISSEKDSNAKKPEEVIEKADAKNDEDVKDKDSTQKEKPNVDEQKSAAEETNIIAQKNITIEQNVNAEEKSENATIKTNVKENDKTEGQKDFVEDTPQVTTESGLLADSADESGLLTRTTITSDTIDKVLEGKNVVDGGRSEQSKCNSEVLKKLMTDNMNPLSSNESKRAINAAAEQKFGGIVDVICSRGHFSYVYTSALFCEASKDELTCIAFRQAV